MKLTHLTFKGTFKFAQAVDGLPDSLIQLSIISDFNQAMNSLPTCLVCLNVNSDSFNQPIDSLPSDLEALKINFQILLLPCAYIVNSTTLLKTSLLLFVKFLLVVIATFLLMIFQNHLPLLT